MNIRPKIYIEFATKNSKIGKVVFELFNDIVPKTVRNFMTLALNKSNPTYLGCTIHRIIPGFVIQGGDYENGDGTGGKSIYGGYFEDECFDYKHNQEGLLSMANCGKNTNGSQFFITLDVAPHLDNNHVVFGKVINGMNIIRKIEQYGSMSGKPKEIIKIVGSGKN